MSIDRSLLKNRIISWLDMHYDGKDIEFVKWLIVLLLDTDPLTGVIRKSPISSWYGLDPRKSLFNAAQGFGLPIGNLTSQLFANFFMSDLDHYIKHDLGIRYYGRYVDDFVLVHEDKEYLKVCLSKIKMFLDEHLHLELNDRKTQLQRVEHGMRFLGAMIERRHINIVDRNAASAFKAIDEINLVVEDHYPSWKECRLICQQINSYLGTAVHYDSFHYRTRLLSSVDNRFLRRVPIADNRTKILIP